MYHIGQAMTIGFFIGVFTCFIGYLLGLLYKKKRYILNIRFYMLITFGVIAGIFTLTPFLKEYQGVVILVTCIVQWVILILDSDALRDDILLRDAMFTCLIDVLKEKKLGDTDETNKKG